MLADHLGNKGQFHKYLSLVTQLRREKASFDNGVP